ncbi:hypothetical protein HDK90DRAFT_110056 [Phyllosticta capitalensis]|uniref:Uncharacterized protein n=1 Tax=Phyllosticta capitalensis TaxID=121624 RepID=A0ABR1YBN7_9PEZI
MMVASGSARTGTRPSFPERLARQSHHEPRPWASLATNPSQCDMDMAPAAVGAVTSPPAPAAYPLRRLLPRLLCCCCLLLLLAAGPPLHIAVIHYCWPEGNVDPRIDAGSDEKENTNMIHPARLVIRPGPPSSPWRFTVRRLATHSSDYSGNGQHANTTSVRDFPCLHLLQQGRRHRLHFQRERLMLPTKPDMPERETDERWMRGMPPNPCTLAARPVTRATAAGAVHDGPAPTRLSWLAHLDVASAPGTTTNNSPVFRPPLTQTFSTLLAH